MKNTKEATTMTKLYFATYYGSPKQKIVLEEREAELIGNVYHFSHVSGLRSRITIDEVDTCLGNDCAVSLHPNKAVSLLRENFIKRAEKLERKLKTLRAASNLVEEKRIDERRDEA